MTGTIRSLEAKDLATILAWRNHFAVRERMFTQHEITPQEHGAWFAAACLDQNRHLLVYEEESTPCAFVHFTQKAKGIGEWGFYAAPDAQKGTGTRMANAALEYVFEHINFHKVIGEVIDTNAPSLRFHQKLGFVREGTYRAQHWDGQTWRDVILFGLLRKEYKP